MRVMLLMLDLPDAKANVFARDLPMEKILHHVMCLAYIEISHTMCYIMCQHIS